MWWSQRRIEKVIPAVVPIPHPQALRIREIEQSIENGFWRGGGKVAGAFAVVAKLQAETEARIAALEAAGARGA